MPDQAPSYPLVIPLATAIHVAVFGVAWFAYQTTPIC